MALRGEIGPDAVLLQEIFRKKSGDVRAAVRKEMGKKPGFKPEDMPPKKIREQSAFLGRMATKYALDAAQASPTTRKEISDLMAKAFVELDNRKRIPLLIKVGTMLGDSKAEIFFNKYNSFLAEFRAGFEQHMQKYSGRREKKAL
jgi:hypothetical protein